MGTSWGTTDGKTGMNIGIITSSFPLNPKDTVNAGVFIRDIAIELSQRGHKVHVITPRKSGKREKEEYYDVHFIPWVGGEKDLTSLPARKLLPLFRLFSLIASGLVYVTYIVRKRKIEVLLAMWAIPSGLFAWNSWHFLKVPYGIWALGSDIWHRNQYPFGDRIVKKVLGDANFRFADGDQLSQKVSTLCNKPCSFLPSIRQLDPGASDKPVRLDANSSHLLFVGRYELNKGPDLLIRAARMLIDDSLPIELHMFGEGSMKNELVDLTQGYEKRIHVGGILKPGDLRSYMKACTWLIIPSRIESIPLIFVDALQMRLPVIATDVGNLGEMVKKFDVGLVIKRPNAIEISKAIHSAISMKLALKNPKWEEALNLFDFNRVVENCEIALLAAIDT